MSKLIVSLVSLAFLAVTLGGCASTSMQMRPYPHPRIYSGADQAKMVGPKKSDGHSDDETG
jgi:hypothetical protein